MRKIVLVTINILAACLLPTNTNAASFDCNKAATWVEDTICRNPELSKLDDAVAKKYKNKLAKASEYEDRKSYKDRTINEQRNWIKFQRDTCEETVCLVREY